jgi:hypothetical protein
MQWNSQNTKFNKNCGANNLRNRIFSMSLNLYASKGYLKVVCSIRLSYSFKQLAKMRFNLKTLVSYMHNQLNFTHSRNNFTSNTTTI